VNVGVQVVLDPREAEDEVAGKTRHTMPGPKDGFILET